MASIIIKSTLEKHFTIISNEFARDPNVTPRAARVYIYLMSNAEGWETSAERISSLLKMGEGSVKSALNDLTSLGYLNRERIHGDDGRFMRMEYQLSATPDTTVQKTSDGSTCKDNANAQVGASGRNTSGGETSGGKATPLRRPSFKKTNEKKTNDKILDESGDSPHESKPKRNAYSEEFNDWWFRFPKRTGSKKNAFTQFKLAVKRIPLDELNVATDRLRAFVEAGHQDPQFLKDAERWLKEDRWEEELVPRQAPPPRQGGSTNTVDAWLGRAPNATSSIPEVSPSPFGENTIEHEGWGF